jgi:chromosome segregation ATPase
VAGQQEQVQKYARQLSEQEATLAGLRDRAEELRKQKNTLESELATLIEKMEF